MDNAGDHLAAVATAARSAARQPGVPETLQAIVEAARLSVPGFDHAGISLRAPASPPCGSNRSSRCHEQRWPAYIPAAVSFGLRAQLAVRLFLDPNGSMGGLNLYSTTTEEIPPDAEHIADLLAAHAALALDETREVEHLHEALHSRKVIGQAIGILMQRYELDEEAAFAYLLRASSHGNTKLRTVAEQLVSETSRAHARRR